MDTGSAVKLPASAAQMGHARPDSAPVPQAVRTELAAPRSVTAAEKIIPSRNNAARAPDAFAREVVIDPQTREVLFRVVDVRSRQVVRQVPDEALLRLRAYARALASGTSLSKVLSQADLEA
jgi:hypothetical protein